MQDTVGCKQHGSARGVISDYHDRRPTNQEQPKKKRILHSGSRLVKRKLFFPIVEDSVVDSVEEEPKMEKSILMCVQVRSM